MKKQKPHKTALPPSFFFYLPLLFLFGFGSISFGYAQSAFKGVWLGATMNSEFGEINPILSPDGNTLYFVRTQHPHNIEGSDYGQDIWMSKRVMEEDWTPPVSLTAQINDDQYNGVGGTSADGNYLIYTSFSTEKDANPPQVLKSYNNGSDWKKGKKVLKDEYFSSQGFFSFYCTPDENLMVVSMEQDAFSGEDLFVLLKDDAGKWSEPINLGRNINSNGFEIGPFLSPDKKTLYFSSNGHGGFGDGDIFMSSRLDDSWTSWTKPVNLGPEVNTNGFDGYFILHPFAKRAYFCSGRVALNPSDLYTIELDDIESLNQTFLFCETTMNTPLTLPVQNIDFSKTDFDITKGYSIRRDGGKVNIDRTSATPFSYIPPDGFYGTDTIKIIICNQFTPPRCKQVNVYVDVFPSGFLRMTTPENTPLILNTDTLIKWPVNWEMCSGKSLEYKGKVQISPLERWPISYIPPSDFTGLDSIEISIPDTSEPPNYEKIKILVQITTAEKLSLSTFSGIPLSFNLKGIEKKDIDPSLSSGKSHISSSLFAFKPDQEYSIVYRPEKGFVGQDSVDLKVCFRNGNCLPFSVDIEVTPPETLKVRTMKNRGVSVSVQNEEAVVTKNTSGFSLINKGSVKCNSKGGSPVVFTPAKDFVGLDSLYIQVAYGELESDFIPYVVIAEVMDAAPREEYDFEIELNTAMNQPIEIDVSPFFNGNFDYEASQAQSLMRFGTPVVNPSSPYFEYLPRKHLVGYDSIRIYVCAKGNPPTCQVGLALIDIVGKSPKKIEVDTLESITQKGQSVVLEMNVDSFENQKIILSNTLTYPKHGKILENKAHSKPYTYSPGKDFAGMDYISFQLCDKEAILDCHGLMYRIIVQPEPGDSTDIKPPPVFVVNTDTVKTKAVPEVIPPKIDTVFSQNTASTEVDRAIPLPVELGTGINFSKTRGKLRSGRSRFKIINGSEQPFMYYPAKGFIGTDTVDIRIVELGKKAPPRIETVIISVKPVIISVQGTITDAKTQRPIPALLVVQPLEQKDILHQMTANNDGEFELKLDPGAQLHLSASKPGFFPVVKTLKLENMGQKREMNVNFELSSLETKKIYPLTHIYFEVNSASLKRSAYNELNLLADLLLKKTDIKADLICYSFGAVATQTGTQLALERAKAIENYLLNKGVDASQVTGRAGDPQEIPSYINPNVYGWNARMGVKILSQ